MAERDVVQGSDEYEGLHPGEVWARVCEMTGIQARTTKIGDEFTWEDFAALAEATIGLVWQQRCEAADELRKLLDGERGWRPIETAPKDGTFVLAYYGDYFGAAYDVLMWSAVSDSWMDEYGVKYMEPTHWMPLPDPPEPDTDQGGEGDG